MTKQEKDKEKPYKIVEYDFSNNEVPDFMQADIDEIEVWLKSHKLSEQQINELIKKVKQVREEYKKG